MCRRRAIKRNSDLGKNIMPSPETNVKLAGPNRYIETKAVEAPIAVPSRNPITVGIGRPFRMISPMTAANPMVPRLTNLLLTGELRWIRCCREV